MISIYLENPSIWLKIHTYIYFFKKLSANQEYKRTFFKLLRLQTNNYKPSSRKGLPVLESLASKVPQTSRYHRIWR